MTDPTDLAAPRAEGALPLPGAASENAARPQPRPWWKRIALPALGLLALVVVASRSDLAEVAAMLRSFGWGLLLFLALDGFSDVLHAIGLAYCLPAQPRISLRRLLLIRFIARAYNYITPLSNVGGDLMKVSLLRRDQTTAAAAATTLIDKFTFGVSQFGVAFFGSAVLLLELDVTPAIRQWFWILSAVTWSLLAVLLFVQHQGWLAPMFRRLSARFAHRPWIAQMQHTLTDLDEGLRTYYRTRPLALAQSILWHTLSFLVDILMVEVFLQLTLGVHDWKRATAIWCLGAWFDVVVPVIPAGIGTQELSRAAIFKAIAFTWDQGITYAVILRVSQLFWAGVGVLAHLADARKHTESNAARPAH